MKKSIETTLPFETTKIPNCKLRYLFEIKPGRIRIFDLIKDTEVVENKDDPYELVIYGQTKLVSLPWIINLSLINDNINLSSSSNLSIAYPDSIAI